MILACWIRICGRQPRNPSTWCQHRNIIYEWANLNLCFSTISMKPGSQPMLVRLEKQFSPSFSMILGSILIVTEKYDNIRSLGFFCHDRKFWATTHSKAHINDDDTLYYSPLNIAIFVVKFWEVYRMFWGGIGADVLKSLGGFGGYVWVNFGGPLRHVWKDNISAFLSICACILQPSKIYAHIKCA